MSTKKKAASKKTTKKADKEVVSVSEEKLIAETPEETPAQSLLSDEVVEIKEIIEVTPKETKEEKKTTGKGKNPARKGTVLKGIAGFFGLLCYPFVSVWKGAQRGTRYFIVGSSLFGIIMTTGVVVLSLRLGNMEKELKSVQTMSVGLQEDLEEALDEVAQKDLLLFSKQNPLMAESVRATPIPTPTPTATPIPSPTPAPPKYVVCVDAGHGDWDGGAGYYEQRADGLLYRVRNEKDDNLRMAKWFREALEEYDVQVVMTRESDVFLELEERTDIANEVNADALISFHRNSYPDDSSISGVEFWIHSSRPEDARILARDMLAAIMDVGGMVSRGVKWGSMSSTKEDYAINRRAKMTSMIVELGFISSEADNEAYDTYGKRYAEEMAKVVFEWLEKEQKITENQ